MTQPLQPLSFPLFGSQLIEASAGTGKTYTIALLYTRLILQHGQAQAFHRALTPEEILVVTFTDAATQELKDRIRARLSDAAQCFLDPDASGDPSLLDLRDSYPPEEWPDCARRLTLAMQSMDQAAVSTIHGWCYRMLREHAFDSGTLFQQTLNTNMQDIHAELIRDYWRRHFYSLSADSAALIAGTFSSPDALLKAVQPLLNKTNTVITYRDQPLDTVASLGEALHPFVQMHTAINDELARARALWLQHWDELNSLLDQLRPGMHLGSYKAAKDDCEFTQLKQQLLSWSQGDSFAGNLALFGSAGMKLKKGFSAPDHIAMHAIDRWAEAVALAKNEDRPTPRSLIMQHARQWMEQALEQRIHARAELGFDDLLLQLDRALQGPRGDSLAAQIRTEFPVALIDEFQDTDPLQYRIFDRIYRIADNSTEQALILIGDPKQSIYSFRNADIHTYLAARQATTGRHYHLDTNYRSSQALVDSVNTCFSHAENLPAGAFCFKNGEENPVPFTPVYAKGRNEVLSTCAGPAHALTFLNLQAQEQEKAVISKGQYVQDLAAICAAQIVEILDSSRPWTFQGHTSTPVKPSDIAILVRDFKEASAIRQALQQVGLASAYLSDRESVFASTQAGDVLRWLNACAEPGNEQLIRAALATRSLDLPFSQLTDYYQHEQVWEQQTELFRQLQLRWQRDGVLPMLRELMQHYQLPQRLQQQPDGERALTNLLHLAEYLQQASVGHEGQQALIRHLSEMIENPGQEEILRLESDEDLIRVVTIHKSKGLQYPLVFVPYAANWRDQKSDQAFTVADPDNPLQRRLEIGKSDKNSDSRQQADEERLAEDMRLLYVAMTRAVHALWIGVGLVTQGTTKSSLTHRSGIGYLLAGGKELDRSSLSETLSTLAARCNQITVQTVSDIPPLAVAAHTPCATGRPAAVSKPAAVPRHSPPQPWWISSYSAIKAGAHDSEPEAASVDQTLEEQQSGRATEADSTGPRKREFNRLDAGLHGFPRGPREGTFLHDLLEWACDFGFAQAAEDDESRRTVIQKRCQVRGWDDETDRLDSWLKQFLLHEFLLTDNGQFTLSELNTVQAEMEFLFAADTVDTQQIDKLCSHYLLNGAPRPTLRPATLNGMIKGFIDLSFCHNGRYYVADWKSNHLGRTDADYHPQALQQEVLLHRYDVQYAIYLLALHRLLRSRLSNYDYDQHIGGAVYFFLRGWQSDSQGILFDKPGHEFIDSLDQLFSGGR